MPHGKRFVIPGKEDRGGPKEAVSAAEPPKVCRIPTTDTEGNGYCPECAAKGMTVRMVAESGCSRCPECGYSPCH
ncbi:MAG: hypothetical protein ACYC9Q_09060 [Bacillota bacterium]